MNKSNKLGRGLEDVSYLFLSSPQTEMAKENKTGGQTIYGIHCCCLPFEMRSFFACNFSLEIAKRNKSVTILDLGMTQPGVRYLMGNLVNVQDDPAENGGSVDCIVEKIKLHGFAQVTIISLNPAHKDNLKEIVEKIAADKKLQESEILLINLPDLSTPIHLPDNILHPQKTLCILDTQIRTLLETYGWIKKFSSLCKQFLISAIIKDGEDLALSRKPIEKIQKTANKFLPEEVSIALATDFFMDQEAINSIKLRRPLALIESSSASAKSISLLCENLME